MHTRHYHNGLKTTVLLGGMWALLLAIGYAIALGTRQSMWISSSLASDSSKSSGPIGTQRLWHCVR